MYLLNKGGVTLSVNASINYRAAQPGFSVSSDTINIKPGERSSLDLRIKKSSQVLGFTGASLFNVVFYIKQLY